MLYNNIQIMWNKFVTRTDNCDKIDDKKAEKLINDIKCSSDSDARKYKKWAKDLVVCNEIPPELLKKYLDSVLCDAPEYLKARQFALGANIPNDILVCGGSVAGGCVAQGLITTSGFEVVTGNGCSSTKTCFSGDYRFYVCPQSNNCDTSCSRSDVYFMRPASDSQDYTDFVPDNQITVEASPENYLSNQLDACSVNLCWGCIKGVLKSNFATVKEKVCEKECKTECKNLFELTGICGCEEECDNTTITSHQKRCNCECNSGSKSKIVIDLGNCTKLIIRCYTITCSVCPPISGGDPWVFNTGDGCLKLVEACLKDSTIEPICITKESCIDWCCLKCEEDCKPKEECDNCNDFCDDDKECDCKKKCEKDDGCNKCCKDDNICKSTDKGYKRLREFIAESFYNTFYIKSECGKCDFAKFLAKFYKPGYISQELREGCDCGECYSDKPCVNERETARLYNILLILGLVFIKYMCVKDCDTTVTPVVPTNLECIKEEFYATWLALHAHLSTSYVEPLKDLLSVCTKDKNARAACLAIKYLRETSHFNPPLVVKCDSGRPKCGPGPKSAKPSLCQKELNILTKVVQTGGACCEKKY